MQLNIVALLQRGAKGWKLQDLATWGAKMTNTWEGNLEFEVGTKQRWSVSDEPDDCAEDGEMEV